MVNQCQNEFILNLKIKKFIIYTKILRDRMNDEQEQAKITAILLFEYCKRAFNESRNPEMHFYNIPELKNTDNEAIKLNAIHLINENLVRGGIDEEGSHMFPWITRITRKGLELIGKIINESERKIDKFQEELKFKTSTREKTLHFISIYEDNENVKLKVIKIIQILVPKF